MCPTSDNEPPAFLCMFGQCDGDATIYDHGHWCEEHYGRAMDFFKPVSPRE